MMFYLVPPAGTKYTVSDLTKVVLGLLKGAGAGDNFAQAVCRYTSARNCFLLNSGRSALTVALEALSRLAGPNKDEVVIPAYTCSSVGSAVVNAGLKIRLVDVIPATLDYDYEELQRLDFSRVVAIVGCNLFAVPNDWKRLRQIAAQSDVFLVDDAAQSMGTNYQGRMAGCLGDVGFFSLGRGKNLSAYYGGVLLTDNDVIAHEISKIAAKVPKSGLVSNVDALAKLILSSVFLRPWLYWFPAMLPTLTIGRDASDAYFPEPIKIRLMGLPERCAGLVMLPKLAAINESRRQKGMAMAREIVRMKGYVIPGFNENNSPCYLRLPILFPDSGRRDRALRHLKKLGIQASKMEYLSLHRLPGVERFLAPRHKLEFAGADEIAERLLTLPTHAFMSRKRMRLAVEYLTNL